MYKYSLRVTTLLMAISGMGLPGSSLAQDTPPAGTYTAAAAPAPRGPQPEQAGNAVLAVGTVTATSATGRRQLRDGDAIYSGDAISTGDDSYADLDFEDGGRMLLRPDTDFQIQRYHYDPAAHGYALAVAQVTASSTPPPASPQPTEVQQRHEGAFFRLIKGGFRAISGFIGHVEHQDYAVDTPVATIGIRGTGYEVRYCANNCAPGEQGLYTGVDKGAIALRNQAGESITTAGHFGYVENRTALFRRLHHPPRALRHMNLPARYRERDRGNFRRIQMRRQYRWRQAAERRRRLWDPRGFRARNGLANIRHKESARLHPAAHTRKKRKPRHHDKRRG